MAGLSSLNNVWNNIKEIDLRPLRDEALTPLRIAIAGAPGTGRSELAAQMRRDPLRSEAAGAVETQAPVLVLDLEGAREPAAVADLIILMLGPAENHDRERELARAWANAGKKVLALFNQAAGETTPRTGAWVNWGQRRVLYGSVEDTHFLIHEFAPLVIELLPDRLLALGRNFPLFRVPIANFLINDTCLSNAAYSLSTGVAAIVPVFDIPLNVTDMVVLTKTQAFLVYKLGLALGLSTRWQDYVTEFGSVLGGGFLWRQVARSLIGLIPAWGIIPKVAVAYAGTYVVGHVVLQWYLTGRHISKDQMRQLYTQAFTRGKNIASGLRSKLPRPRLGRRKAKELPAQAAGRVCPNCGRSNAPDAAWCQYCGQKLEQAPAEPLPE